MFSRKRHSRYSHFLATSPAPSSITRRKFLAGLAGTGAMALLSRPAWALTARTCPHCAIELKSRVFTKKGYCANCGLHLSSGRFALRRPPILSSPRRAAGSAPSWNPAQVPFPRVQLRELSRKPCAHLGQIRFRRLPT